MMTINTNSTVIKFMGVVVSFAFLFADSILADELFDVVITGEVEFNQVNSGALGDVNSGELATLSFQVDSGNFVDSPTFPTRGYVIDLSSFQLEFSGGVTVALQDPFPGGQTPFFVLRNNDPMVDGFFISNSVDFPIGVPLNQTGAFGQFSNDFSVTYGGGLLSSLDIAGTVGTYDFTGLSSFNWTINDGPFNATGLIFSNLTISGTAIPEPTTVLPLLGLGLLVASRRKRKFGSQV